ncbi:hypothetical protein LZ30DRAFT_685123 [Colletotrichum cereale]|nr:hypothetical protein LZ30DRAFT_685123 [Colletotrichum cereale]
MSLNPSWPAATHFRLFDASTLPDAMLQRPFRPVPPLSGLGATPVLGHWSVSARQLIRQRSSDAHLPGDRSPAETSTSEGIGDPFRPWCGQTTVLTQRCSYSSYASCKLFTGPEGGGTETKASSTPILPPRAAWLPLALHRWNGPDIETACGSPVWSITASLLLSSPPGQRSGGDVAYSPAFTCLGDLVQRSSQLSGPSASQQSGVLGLASMPSRLKLSIILRRLVALSFLEARAAAHFSVLRRDLASATYYGPNIAKASSARACVTANKAAGGLEGTTSELITHAKATWDHKPAGIGTSTPSRNGGSAGAPGEQDVSDVPRACVDVKRCIEVICLQIHRSFLNMFWVCISRVTGRA